ncbi:hypothetical protein H072_5737 [Dactylellina haptotyla CBS 200.50]|uniref:Uncharacterized protein n=1 Tax=Dactylellina haptotyla (strain CBS 200.50) TaxID=1284197 RepID=S8BYK5_DACHA|nr:hypothetical protein H072_5737 [Dactylellina haptotyla CBS 200.50]
MEDPTASWQDPSQSFGYSMPQSTVVAPKNPFASNPHGSPSRSRSYRIRWHNSGAEDYNPVADGNVSHKRNASMAMLETNFNYHPDQLITERDVSITPTNSNTQQKKRKPSSSTSIASSPVKSKQISDPAFEHCTPEANPPMKKRRGRPPKTYPPPNHNPSKLEFVHETGLDSVPVSQGPAPHARPHSSPALHPLDTYVAYPPSNLGSVSIDPLGDVDFQTHKYWDVSFTAPMMENNHMVTAFSTMAGEVDLVAATATFDWSVLPSASMINTATPTAMNPLRPMALHSLGESFFHDVTHPDTFNFSFAQDPMSASDIISPVSVNPNLIFAGDGLDKSFGGDLDGFRPYHQQSLQQQEPSGGNRKRQSKAAPPKAHLNPSLKAAARVAAGKSGIKRALTESILIKSTTKSGNIAVHPSPMKQMGSFSGKVRPAIRDENTTPSPTVDSEYARHMSPKTHGAKNGSRKAKTAVSFSISPSGRAKAEAVIVRTPDTLSEHSDSDDGHGQYDSDSSTDEDDLDPLTSYSMAAHRLAGSKGQNYVSPPSLSHPTEKPKLARFKTAPVDSFSSSSRFLMSGDFASESFSLENNPFLQSNISMSRYNKSPRRKGKSSRHHSRNLDLYNVKSSVGASHPTLGSMREEEEYSEAETVADEPTSASQGDAILALKQAVARRNSCCAPGGSSRRPPSSYGTSRPSTRHTNVLPSSPPMQQHPYGFSTPQTVRSGYSSDAFNISPTTVTDPDCVTPTTYGSNIGVMSDIAMDMRCNCGSTGSPEMPVLQW